MQGITVLGKNQRSQGAEEFWLGGYSQSGMVQILYHPQCANGNRYEGNYLEYWFNTAC